MYLQCNLFKANIFKLFLANFATVNFLKIYLFTLFKLLPSVES